MQVTPRRFYHSGFTLIEILVVIAIITVLAMLLFSVFNRAREKGRSSVCQSNLKQISLGVHQYIQDNDAKPPSSDNWRKATSTYIKNPDIFRCPSLPESIKSSDDSEYNDGDYSFYIGFLNSLVTVPTSTTPKQAFVGVNESILVEAPKIFVSGDFVTRDAKSQSFSRQIAMPQPDACGMTMGNGKPDFLQTASTIHTGGGNYLFYDGHVKWLTPESFVDSLCDAAQYLQPPFRADGDHMK